MKDYDRTKKFFSLIKKEEDKTNIAIIYSQIFINVKKREGRTINLKK